MRASGDGQEASNSVKLVLLGAPWSGKSTCLRALHAALPSEGRSELGVALGLEGPELGFEGWPRDPVYVAGEPLRLCLRTVPGEWELDGPRTAVLADADAVLFVADSSPGRLAHNVERFRDMERALRELGRDPETFPLVMAWNKRDLPHATPTAVLQERLKRYRYEAPAFPTVATSGAGLLLCLQVTTWIVAEARRAALMAKGRRT